VLLSDTVAVLKQRVKLAIDIPENEQSLWFNAHELEDTMALGKYGLSNGSVVHLRRIAKLQNNCRF
jgi:hypothetical protein